jgi:uncharacterized membrane protein
MTAAKEFFTADQQEAIRQAIIKAEENTSGEIRVHIEEKCEGDPVVNAVKAFAKLKMYKTKLRNGVLFYLAVGDRKFAIIGDGGINEVVPADFWDKIKEHMLNCFKQGKFTEGLCEGLHMAGEQLKAHFPYKRADVNELKDEVSFGK